VIFSSHREIQCVHRQGCWYFTRWWSHWLRRHSEREATTLPKNHSSLSESKASFFYPSVIPVNYDDGGFAFSPSFHACPSGDKKLDEYRRGGRGYYGHCMFGMCFGKYAGKININHGLMSSVESSTCTPCMILKHL
jgi:hypothetical protein